MPIVKAKKAKKVAKAEEPADALDKFVEDMNKMMKGVGRIDRGRNVKWIDPERIQTGILGLDVVSCGGIPRGSASQFWGPFSTGKTTTAIQTMKAEQRRGKHGLFGAAEGFGKDWARKNGLWIPYSDDEYEAAAGDHALIKSMEAYDQWGRDSGFGDVFVLQHLHGDGLLEAMVQGLKRNLFSVMVLDSLAMLRNSRQIEEEEVGQESYGGGGTVNMYNRFVAKAFSALNTKYDDEGKVDMNGGVGNQTALICINQARIKIGGMSRGHGPSYQAPGGEGLKHAWHFSILFSKGEEMGEEVRQGDRTVWSPYGHEVQIRCNKSKVGIPYRTARWELYTEDGRRDGFNAGDVNTAKEVRTWGVYYKIIETNGAWYSYNGDRIGQGGDKVDAYLRENPELAAEISAKVIAACRRV